MTPSRLSQPCAEVSLLTPSSSNNNTTNNDYSAAIARLFVLLCSVRRRLWRLLHYQQEQTNTNTFAWVIDLYLPTFLTAFSCYWQHKHKGRRITFHSQSTFSLFVSLCLSPLVSLSLSAHAICLNKTGQTMVLLISAIFLSLQISGDNIITPI